ncbi:Hypp3497 [Branchiostoma lanceolatum]|uniref:Hypp3497 protein n=1 Tax=Branchiostoma lanceolatum TaxID=7740 RepID=A0A8K0ES51_BRALA|nr:Hypp3497 [Branchiostoma lanceolatum]
MQSLDAAPDEDMPSVGPSPDATQDEDMPSDSAATDTTMVEDVKSFDTAPTVKVEAILAPFGNPATEVYVILDDFRLNMCGVELDVHYLASHSHCYRTRGDMLFTKSHSHCYRTRGDMLFTKSHSHCYRTRDDMLFTKSHSHYYRTRGDMLFTKSHSHCYRTRDDMLFTKSHSHCYRTRDDSNEGGCHSTSTAASFTLHLESDYGGMRSRSQCLIPRISSQPPEDVSQEEEEEQEDGPSTSYDDGDNGQDLTNLFVIDNPGHFTTQEKLIQCSVLDDRDPTISATHLRTSARKRRKSKRTDHRHHMMMMMVTMYMRGWDCVEWRSLWVRAGRMFPHGDTDIHAPSRASIRKVERRGRSLENSCSAAWTDRSKKRVEKILDKSYLSSETSGDEGQEGFRIHPFAWGFKSLSNYRKLKDSLYKVRPHRGAAFSRGVRQAGIRGRSRAGNQKWNTLPGTAATGPTVESFLEACPP